jgi:Ca2+-binding EF-hand superfamily protein
VLLAGLAFSGAAVDNALAQSKAEIQDMDRNGDGVVTRAEWQGPNGAFRLHDTNKDGVLSGTEVWDAKDVRGRGRNRTFDDWTARGFANLDRNRDNRITADEWRFDRRSFALADRNRDNVISRAEFFDQNRLSGNRVDRFRDFDTNNDGVIARGEWHDSDLSFRALDQNRDHLITRNEFDQVAGTSGTAERSSAYRAGYERGQAEGRAAGREDRDRNQGWDIEGQRELESADSGYDPRIGPKPEYQAGYRDGFRAAYPDGWDRR